MIRALLLGALLASCALGAFKNVLVLKNVPEPVFMDTMKYFTTALGVKCMYCHVQGNFAAEDKPAKAMARKMIVMTRAINADTFGGKDVVRCYTCHSGQTNPRSHPPFE